MAVAQEQTGAIEGVVKDSSGAVRATVNSITRCATGAVPTIAANSGRRSAGSGQQCSSKLHSPFSVMPHQPFRRFLIHPGW